MRGVSSAARKRPEPYSSPENTKVNWATVKREKIGKGRREASRLQRHPVPGHFPRDKRPRNGLVRLRCDAPATDPTEQPQSSVKVGPDPPWGGGGGYIGPGPCSFWAEQAQPMVICVRKDRRGCRLAASFLC